MKSNGKNLDGRLVWNDVRAGEVFPEIYQAYVEKRGYYVLAHHTYRPDTDPGKVYAPQHEFRPELAALGSGEHRLFQFHTTGIDYRSVSRSVYAASRRLFEGDDQWCFSLGAMAKENDIAGALKRAKFNYPSQGAERWKSLARTVNDLGGEPKEVFNLGEGVDDLLEVRRREQKRRPYFLNGYGPKLLSLLALIFREFGYIKRFHGAFPVDKHVQSILLSLGVVEILGEEAVDAAGLAEFIRARMVAFYEAHSMSPVFLSHALWFLGNGVCTRCLKLRGMGGGLLARECPVAAVCGGPKYSSYPYSLQGKWDPQIAATAERPARGGAVRLSDVNGRLF